MTLRVVVSCNGVLGSRPCRNAISTGPIVAPAKVRARLAEHGWTHDADGEFCPACSRRRAAILARQGS